VEMIISLPVADLISGISNEAICRGTRKSSRKPGARRTGRNEADHAVALGALEQRPVPFPGRVGLLVEPYRATCCPDSPSDGESRRDVSVIVRGIGLFERARAARRGIHQRERALERDWLWLPDISATKRAAPPCRGWRFSFCDAAAC
jgi:hypothetical protein